jgi:hypothetical protein
MVQRDDDAPESPFTLPVEDLVDDLPGAKRADEALSSDSGMILTVMLATWSFLGLLAYVGMFGP